MTMVNELLQNIRFLKFYGWGTSPCPASNTLNRASLQRIDGRKKRGIPVRRS